MESLQFYGITVVIHMYIRTQLAATAMLGVAHKLNGQF